MTNTPVAYAFGLKIMVKYISRNVNPVTFKSLFIVQSVVAYSHFISQIKLHHITCYT